MNRVTLLTILVVLLFIINSITLYFQFQKPKGRRQPPPDNPGMIFKKLNLDAQQEQQFKEMRKTHFQRRDSLKAEDMRLRKSMTEMIAAGVTDEQQIDSITNLLAANRKQFETNFYHHFQQLYSILRPEQKKDFGAVLDELLKRQKPPDRRPPGPPPHQP
ncbi:MAG: periplasmic heavy metal sensor [Chitinophagaceae bacterium]|nr:periplasmic heavy metal sensor [Chitinophagaceae bacterium]